jgi:hypothetical protein
MGPKANHYCPFKSGKGHTTWRRGEEGHMRAEAEMDGIHLQERGHQKVGKGKEMSLPRAFRVGAP